jgi:hypothetical protein
MSKTLRAINLRERAALPVGLGGGEQPTLAPPQRPRRAATAFWRRLDRVALGFWLGALALGAAGCMLGARVPCRHPVAWAVSVLWWGIYLGCFGASLGALVAVVTDRTRADRGASRMNRKRRKERASKRGAIWQLPPRQAADLLSTMTTRPPRHEIVARNAVQP